MRMILIKIMLIEIDIENLIIYDVEVGVVFVFCRKVVVKYSLMK